MEVDQHHPPSFEHGADRVELHLDAEIPNRLMRFDERATHVVVADEPELEGGPEAIE